MLNKIELKCKQCNDIFHLSKRHVRYNELGDKSRQIDLCKKCLNKNNHDTKQYFFDCKKCSKEYSLILTKNNYLNNNYTTHCSRKCANSRILTNEIKNKISNGVKHYVIDNKKYSKISYCLTCTKVIKGNNKYCSEECRNELFRTPEHRNKMSCSLKGKTGGIREGGGYSKMVEYINKYNNKMYLNKEEILVAKWLDSLNIKWQRNNKGFKYTDLEGNEKNFFPDFYISSLNIYVEYKGWLIPKMSHKMVNTLQNNDINLLLIFSNDKRFKHINDFNLSTIKEKNEQDIINNVNSNKNIKILKYNETKEGHKEK